MPPRRHTLTARVLHKLTPVQIFNAHKAAAVAAQVAGSSIDEMRLMLVKMQRLHLEAIERLMVARGEPFLTRVDMSPLEPYLMGRREPGGQE